MPNYPTKWQLGSFSTAPSSAAESMCEVAGYLRVLRRHCDSGRYQGMRKIRDGRPQICTVIFMGMMSTIQCNAVFKQKYNALVAAGKSKKVVIIACVRQLIVTTLNAMLRNGTQWNPKMS